MPQTAVRFALLGARFLDGPGGEGTPYNGLYGEAERGAFFRKKLYERVQAFHQLKHMKG